MISKITFSDNLNVDHPLEYKVTIVDWVKAGWYLSSWEYSLALYPLKWGDDWRLFFQKW